MLMECLQGILRASGSKSAGGREQGRYRPSVEVNGCREKHYGPMPEALSVSFFTAHNVPPLALSGAMSFAWQPSLERTKGALYPALAKQNVW